jgi:hypothetical protein
MNSDFLTPSSNVNLKDCLNCSKGLFITKGPKKGPKEAKRAQNTQKWQKWPKGVQECLTEMNSDFLIPPNNVNAKNAETIQRGSS